MAYKAMDVAEFIINYSRRCKSEIDDKVNFACDISVLRLNSLLYFVQACFLAEKGKPCFDDNLSAWGFGAVVESVYNRFQFHGCYEITSSVGKVINHGTILDTIEWEEIADVISAEDRKLIGLVIDNFSKFRSYNLQQIIMNQEPWKKARVQPLHKIISKDFMKSYFSNLKNKNKEKYT